VFLCSRERKSVPSLPPHAVRASLTASPCPPDVQGGVNKVKSAGNGVADSVSGATSKLPPNALPILGVIVVLSFLPTFFQLLAGQ